jgi:hypothetical protein
VARLFRDELGLSYPQWRQQAIPAHALPMPARVMPVGRVAAAMGRSPSHFQNKNGLPPLMCKHKKLPIQ